MCYKICHFDLHTGDDSEKKIPSESICAMPLDKQTLSPYQHSADYCDWTWYELWL